MQTSIQLSRKPFAVSLKRSSLLAILCSHAWLAQAADFNIPAQTLDKALISLAKQSGERILFSTDLTEKIAAPAVKGNLSTREALNSLLKNSGLTLQGDAAQGYTVVKKSAIPSQVHEDTLPEVAVSAKSDEPSADKEPGTVVIDEAALARNNPSDVRGIFNGQPSVKVGGSTPMSQKVYVNGIEETNLAVTIDGGRQNNKVFHHNGTTLIDPIFMKAVSVNAGVAPADAGAGAIAGSIAYETKNARDFLSAPGIGAYIRSSFNTNGDVFSQTLAGYGVSERVDGLAYLTVANGSRFEAGNGDKVDGTGTDLVSGFFKLGVEAEGGHRLQLSHERVRDDAARPFRGNIGFISGRPAWEPRVRDYEMTRDNTVLRYTQVNPDHWWNPTAVLAYSNTEIAVPVVLSAAVFIPGKGETSSFNGKFENRFPIHIGSINAGVDFYRDKADYRDRTMQADEKASNHGVYVQARINPWQPLNISAGIRNDHHELTGTQGSSWSHSGLSSNISGELAVVPELLTLKAGYSEVFSGSQMAENFIMNPLWNYGRGPRATKADNYFAGLQSRFYGFTADAKVFETRIDDARVARFNPVTSAVLARDVRTRGYELGLAYQWEQSFARAKLADIDVTIDGAPTDSDAGNYLATPVGEILYVTVGHRFPSINVTVGGDAEFAQKYNKVSAGTLSFPSYEVFNLYAEYQPQWAVNTKWRVDVRNLFDDTYADRATYQGFGTVTPLYQPGRSVLFSVAATF